MERRLGGGVGPEALVGRRGRWRGAWRQVEGTQGGRRRARREGRVSRREAG